MIEVSQESLNNQQKSVKIGKNQPINRPLIVGTVGLFLIAAYVRHGVVRIASLFGEQMPACCLVVVLLTDA